MSAASRTHLLGRLGAAIRHTALGLLIMAMFAAYSIWLEVSVSDVPGDARFKATVERAAVMCTLVVLVWPFMAILTGRAASILPPARRPGEFLMINIATALGPMLWFLAIMHLGAQTANWIDLGAAPLFSLALALALASHRLPQSLRAVFFGSQRPEPQETGWLAVLANALMLVGTVVVVGSALSSEGDYQILGAALALVSAFGTAWSSQLTSALLKGSSSSAHGTTNLGKAQLTSMRFVLPAAGLWVIWLAMQPASSGLKWTMADAVGAILYVLPVYAYTWFVRKYNVRGTAFAWAMLPVLTSIGAYLSNSSHALTWPTVVGASLIFAGALANGAAET